MITLKNKENEFCPYCEKRWKVSRAIISRVKKYGETDVMCLGCKHSFTVSKRMFLECDTG